MGQMALVVGQAGTGKTTWLMDNVKTYAPGLLLSEYQNVLAITKMHGSRRRLETKLRDACPDISCTVTTIDGFALSILNRWRTALGWSKPILSVAGERDFVETIFGIETKFESVLEAATDLLRNRTVSRIIGESYPLIVIDEFQDCYGPLLGFVKALSVCSTLLLAADDFQLLDTDVIGCPSVEWLRSLNNDGTAKITELTKCHRTSVKGILDAARCLRDNFRSDETTVPVFYCPKEAIAAWKIIDALVLQFYSSPWIGTTALISPSHDKVIQNTLDVCNKQLVEKWKRRPIHWHLECAAREEQERVCEALGVTKNNKTLDGYWTASGKELDQIGTHVVARSQRYAHLRGIKHIPCTLVERHVDIVIHEKRAYGTHISKRILTTVHGAKNREFDNVIVLWPYRVRSDQEQQRRLLYNAITRAKNNCMVLVLRNENKVKNDTILSLLGAPQPAVSGKKKTKGKSPTKVKINDGRVKTILE